MALSKSADARKRYKGKPPDFAYLATKYPDFKQQVQINLHGGMDQSSIMRSIMTFKGEDVGSYHYFEANEAFANTLDPFANPADLTH
ncbi:hypothetical protein MJT46_005120 [Ovis ammon polii x Ovis aries]|nr:hypothetical protein MJT46_005120 [Ovis ammon polii x Ovis aries]